MMLSLSSFDWKNLCWKDDSLRSGQTATVCIAGDWAPIRALKPVIEKNPESVYGDLLPVLAGADLSIVNLEAPLGNRGTAACKSGSVFKGNTKHIRGLTCVPFNVATLANNHVFDYGLDAFKDTLTVLKSNSIQALGAGMSLNEAARPLLLLVNGLCIAIVNFSEGEDLTAAGDGPGVMGWDPETITRLIHDLKGKVDFIIAIGHCGVEYIPFPPPYVVNLFKKIAQAGADIVVGHHPHVPQGLGFIDQVPICYSLGNFVFYQETQLLWRKTGYLIRLNLSKASLVSFELIPYQINDQGLHALTGSQLEYFRQTFEKLSIPLNDDHQVELAWHGFLHHCGQNGFISEIKMILEKMEEDPEKGAAMFRNRLTTHQHFHHWKDLLTRMMDKTLDQSPEWASAMVQTYMTKKLSKNDEREPGICRH